MPFREVSKMDARLEFVTLAQSPGANIRELCRRFTISPDTAYRLLQRYRDQGASGLVDLSRRPHKAPGQTAEPIVAQIVALRRKHASWGGRKIHHRLKALHRDWKIPAASTVTDILRRHDLIASDSSQQHTAFVRFERAAPNELWQMDFKGPMASDQGDCHPLTVLDDHSRFNLVLEACPDQKGPRVQGHLIQAFRRYGLPRQILSDNGSPWGTSHQSVTRLTALSVWLIRLGIHPIHGRIYHPQTQGKEERFHRTLAAAVAPGRRYASVQAYVPVFKEFRDVYNLERPHEALGMATPASKYQASAQRYPETLPEVEYAPEDQTRYVERGGEFSFRGHDYFISEALKKQRIALRPTTTDGLWDAYFCTRKIAQLDERSHTIA